MLKALGSTAMAAGSIAILPLLSAPLAITILSLAALWTALVTVGYLSSNTRKSQQHNIMQYAILPVAVVLVVGAFVRFAAPEWVVPFAVLGSAFMLPLALLCQTQKVATTYGPKHRWEVVSQVLCYLVAFVLFITVKRLELPVWVGIISVGTCSSALAVEIFGWAGVERKRIGLYSALIGFFLMETAWGLTFWSLRGLTMGLLLLLFYYSAAGIAHHHLMGRLTSTMVMEFVAVAIIGSVLLYSVQPLAS